MSNTKGKIIFHYRLSSETFGYTLVCFDLPLFRHFYSYFIIIKDNVYGGRSL